MAIDIYVLDEQTSVSVTNQTMIIRETEAGEGCSEIYLRISEGFLQYSTDNVTWNNLATVQNGADGNDGVGIQSIAKTGTNGLVDTYTITFTNDTKTTFTVTNGKDGSNYVLTTADKEEIAGMVNVPVKSVNGKTGVVNLSASDVGARPNTWTPSASEVGAEASGTATSKVSEHNTSETSHNDIRLLIEGLTNKLNALSDSDDTTLYQMSEIVAYIKSNKSLIDAITTGKVSVSDIIDNLTTSVSNKPLSAKQGVALKALIDEVKTTLNNLVVPTKTSQLTNDSGFLTQHQDLSGYAPKATTLAGYGITDGATKGELGQVQETISGIREPKERVIDVEWFNGYVNHEGSIAEHSDYNHTKPLKLLKGETIKVSSQYYLFTAISLTDENGTYYKPVVKAVSGNQVLKEYSYMATEDCYVVVSAYTKSNMAKVVTVYDRYITEKLLENLTHKTSNELLAVKVKGYELYREAVVGQSPYGNLILSEMYDTLVFDVDGVSSVLVENIPIKNCGYMYFSGEVSSENVLTQYTQFSSILKIFKDDAVPRNAKRLVICGENSLTTQDYTNLKYTAKGDGIGKSYCKINLFPFRTLTGKIEYLYKESLVSGMKSLSNFDVTPAIRSQNIDNYSEKALCFHKEEEGTYPVLIQVTDQEGFVTEKTVDVYCRNAPQKKLVNKNELNVCFIGDSLIFHNKNLIGSEWLRMLNTSDGETHISGDAIQIPTLNATDGKIRLCGEFDGVNGAKYTSLASSYILCTGKRDSTSGAIETLSENPFYNPDSPEEDVIGEDGINKRVDFGWWFDNNIGIGKNPDLIYLATSPNDYANHYGWEECAVDTVVNSMIAICKKIKATCDARQNGNSNVVIKLLQHQPYLYSCHGLNFPPFKQRVLWYMTAEKFVEALNDNDMNDYVELIPVASRFDIDVGYPKDAVHTNPRHNGTTDYYRGDGIHIGTVGAYNYADVLVTDFVADERFD